MAKIKSVIFDWGGVLIKDPAPKIEFFCSNYLNVSRKQFTESQAKYLSLFQTGKITENMFWENICSDLKIDEVTIRSLWGDAFKFSYSPKKKMFDFAFKIRIQGIKTAILSNTELPARKHFKKLNYNQFDVEVFSCEVGMRKPDKNIFNFTLNKLNVSPPEAIFIDDKIEYTNVAKRLKINTINETNANHTIRKINELLNKTR